MRVSTLKYQAVVHCQKMLNCPIRVEIKFLLQVKVLKYLGFFFMSQGENEVDQCKIGTYWAVKLRKWLKLPNS